MTIKEATEIIEKHNAWRCGDDSEMEHPAIITQALNVLIRVARERVDNENNKN